MQGVLEFNIETTQVETYIVIYMNGVNRYPIASASMTLNNIAATI